MEVVRAANGLSTENSYSHVSLSRVLYSSNIKQDERGQCPVTNDLSRVI